MNKVDVSGWGSFLIGDLFEKQEGLKPKSGFQKNFDVSTEQDEEFKVPIVNAKHGNNGIMYYGKSQFFDTVENAIDIVQNGAASVGDVYYQKQATGVLGDAFLVKVKDRACSDEQMLFLTAVLYKVIKGRFSYDDKAIWDRVKKVRMPLPITPNGDPDWAYMDSYIKTIQTEAKQTIDLFARIASAPQ